MDRSRRNSLATQFYDAAKEVHEITGAGGLPSVFKACLAHELRLRGLRFRMQPKFPVIYKGLKLEEEITVDFLIEEEILVVISQQKDIYQSVANLVSALRMANFQLGIVLDISQEKLVDGFKKINHNLKK